MRDAAELSLSRDRSGLTLLDVVIAAAIIVLVLLVAMGLTSSRDARFRTIACRSGLKHISLALKQYADVHGVLPPAYTVDANGNPLHSWRTLLLPYLDQQQLYDQIDLSKPWNSVENAPFRETFTFAYVCSAARCEPLHTVYCAVVTPESCLRGKESVALTDIKDRLHDTMMIIEVPASKAVPWMAPVDADEAAVVSSVQGRERNHPHGPWVVFADGTIRTVSKSASAITLHGLVTTSGGEAVEEYEPRK